MKRFGLIGKKLSYSYSKIIHEYLIDLYNIDATYELIEVAEISKELLNSYDGLNITIPYKSEVAKLYNSKLVSVNVVCNNEVHDVDYLGFMYPFVNFGDDTRSVVILGDGACSKMIQDALRNFNTTVIETMDNDLDLSKISGDMLINATPVGMNEFESLVDTEIVSHFKYVFDLNYNPINSKLKMQCLEANVKFNNGLEMLIRQAIESFEIFNNIKVKNVAWSNILVHLYKKLNLNIAIIGMPLSGKTTICNKYGGVDLDQLIIDEYGPIEELIKDEANFRKIESDVLSKCKSRLISLGGGAVLNSRNLEYLSNTLIIFLDEDISVLKARYQDGIRPLLKSVDDVEKTYHDRYDKYMNFMNLRFSYHELEEFLDEYFSY